MPSAGFYADRESQYKRPAQTERPPPRALDNSVYAPGTLFGTRDAEHIPIAPEHQKFFNVNFRSYKTCGAQLAGKDCRPMTGPPPAGSTERVPRAGTCYAAFHTIGNVPMTFTGDGKTKLPPAK